MKLKPLESQPPFIPHLEARDLKAITERYQIVREVGRGGTGIVYEAIHRDLQRREALKILNRDFSHQRFQREGRLLARVRSPHVVTIHDLRILPSGAVLLAMEWVEGRNLDDLRQKQGGRIKEPRSLPIMRDTGLGLLAMETEKIIHRDVKPSNILIDGRGQARVADFGLALTNQSLLSPLLTAEDALLGTPYYMAPEQAENPHNADVRSDIYSFGATFYHVLTGKPPFDGDSLFSILFKHKMEPLVSPRAHVDDLSPACCELIERCLSKSPGDRFQSFDDVLLHLGDKPPDDSPWDDVTEEPLRSTVARFRHSLPEYLAEDVRPGVLDEFSFGAIDMVLGGQPFRTIKIVAGDLTEQDVMAVVSSDDNHLSMGGGVSRAIYERGGREIYDEAMIYEPVRPGRVVVTGAGRLPARFVFHGVIMGRLWGGDFLEPTRDLINEIVHSCLYHAETLNVTSIAFPLLGTGTGGFSREVCLDTMFVALARALSRGSTPLEETRIVVLPPGRSMYLA